MKKTLYRSKNKIIFGICGGVAEYFDIDVTLVRLGTVLALILTGFFPVGLFYVLALLIIPVKPIEVISNTNIEKKEAASEVNE